METKYTFNQITKTLEKMFEAGFDTDRKILAMQMDDLKKLSSLSSIEIMIIIEFKEAVKKKQVIAFLSGNKGIGGIDNGISKKNTTSKDRINN